MGVLFKLHIGIWQVWIIIFLAAPEICNQVNKFWRDLSPCRQEKLSSARIDKARTETMACVNDNHWSMQSVLGHPPRAQLPFHRVWHPSISSLENYKYLRRVEEGPPD